MGTQGVEHLPNHAVVFVFVQRVFGFYACGNHHGQNHIALFFALCAAHDTADRLHYVHLRIARGKKQHGIQRRHVHALGQAAHVGENAAGVFRQPFRCFEPLQFGFFFACVHAAVHVFGLALHGKRRRQF